MTKFLLSLFLCASLASGASLIPTPSQINGFGGVVKINVDGSITLQTADGTPIQAFGSAAGFYNGPIVLGAIATPLLSGASQANLYTDGASVFLSVNGGSYVALGASTWGSITGSIGDNTDLTAALNAKLVTANNLSELVASASTARSNLGLASMATQSANSVNILGGTMSGVTITGYATTAGTLGQFGQTTSAALRSVLSDEVGTGAAYFIGGALGTPASVTLTNGTGLPAAGVTGLGSLATITPGTGIATTLGINTGSAGAPVLFNGAGGTPSSINLSNGTALPNASVTGLGALATVTPGTGVATAAAIAVNTTGGPLTHGGAGAHTTLTASGLSSVTNATAITGGSTGAFQVTGGIYSGNYMYGVVGIVAGLWNTSDASGSLFTAINGNNTPSLRIIRSGVGKADFTFFSSGPKRLDIIDTDNSVTPLSLNMAGTGGVVFGGPARRKVYTVATLPSGTEGDMAAVSDALAPTFLGALTGGGTVHTPVYYNGSAWVAD